MEGRRIVFTYHLPEVDECFLTDNEDIASIFLLLRKLAVDQIEVNIQLKDGSSRSIEELNDSNPSMQ